VEEKPRITVKIRSLLGKKKGAYCFFKKKVENLAKRGGISLSVKKRGAKLGWHGNLCLHKGGRMSGSSGTFLVRLTT